MSNNTIKINNKNIDIDATSGILLDAANNSNFTVTGSNQTLTLEATGSGAGNKVIVKSEGTGTDAIKLNATAGGLTLTGANASSFTTSSGALTLTGAAASTWSTAAGALTLDGATGVNIKGNASEVDITTTGLLDINALDVSMVATHDISMCAQNNMLLKAATGGVDIDAETSATIDAKMNSSFTVTGAAKTLTLEAAGGGANQVIVSSAGAGTDAIALTATAGGVDISGTTNVKLSDGSGAYVDVSGGTVEIASAAAGGHINIITNAGTDEKIVIENKQGAASDSVLIKSVGGGIDINGTKVKIEGNNSYVDVSGGTVDISGYS
jgi:hypothetical protein